MTTPQRSRIGPIFLSSVVGLVAAGCGGSATAGDASLAVVTAGPSVTSTPSATPSAAASASPSTAALPLAGYPGWIAYSIGTPEASDVRLVRTDGSDNHAIAHTEGGRHVRAEWRPDGTGIIFNDVIDADGSRAINAFDLATEQVTTLVPCTDVCEDRTEMAISADDRLVYFYADGPVEPVDVDGAAVPLPTACGLRVLDIASDATIELTNHPCALIEERFPRWSPSGDRLAFVRVTYDGRGGPVKGVDLVVRGAADGAERVLATRTTFDEDAPVTMDWAPDGKTIVYLADGQVHAIDAESAADRVIAALEPGASLHPRFTSDGAWIIYFVRRTDTQGVVHSIRLMAVPSGGGEPVEVIPEGPNGTADHYGWASLQPTP